MTFGIHNPLNVRRSAIAWQGKTTDPASPGAFEDYDSDVDGVRSGLLCFLAKFREHGARTIYEAMKLYAPPSENTTRSYAAYVAKAAGVDADAPIDPNDLELLEKVGGAMAWFETKSVIPLDTLKEAALSALAVLGL